ncbi:ribosomal protein S18-alanine N-acetyltransferase [Vibrio parahaemolyticus]|uniref:[Ribosomal protein bS18]-alanine N-acetyltransferase n=1 Tax=Vibrio parahaemolyticus TaxID=670 RepID=A0A9Q3YIG2_VIBPH|nr:ribosomal protein S18-alanine N-acetyltransferase [Vibrio parahaemolyticus]EGQ7797485.1 ribosomal protein S18-alanine N-acetyltransferase [Vibrio parahaemolyticus]EGQ8109769.1 ribosomal-protein-alanine N-acetyltransferase [Vibrio parahaemolyticus]EGQ8196974.1 ribosomal-protein-alanine N-acetyltransferase [Vibrio parahaemolyticus]EGQ8546776.1 ribosomal-protein-alanine N-acetyltransferase [Vibrio parahaemolyticus]EGQ9070574.1 ribosomal-protein-alanine N-acetyltransferase [Vibrio parahaemolyti
MTIEILPMCSEHVEQVWQIEQQAHSHPWAESLVSDLSSRGACHHVMVEDGSVVGYFYAQNIVGEVTLLNIAVAPALQGKGYGQKLLDAFLNHCEQAKADSAWLEVRESNHPAIHIYEQAGFNEVDRRYDYYPAKTGNGKEDAIIMSYLFFN